ncbi:hypothetical protein N7532_009365 [Penicillium argentinense]|uniref:Uncharacterized protein n=1 Tax=Penicillium argentinense TaxID=1131581 RepID=A0A9W9EZF9_9EURO|nr:uncharacterized protein N7532_009365 [Penicillium argentinense]KAJ5090681.1 hypothetical protein N7532_009365 [Penicillium argentinense]
MAQRLNSPNACSSMPPADETRRETPPNKRYSLNPSAGGSSRRSGAPMSDGRVSGELEGSTLGSGSRDGDRKTPGQRRTQSSSGFLLGSLPRTKSLRIPSHRTRLSESPTGKRNAPDANVAVPKKRSRFPWSRNKHSTSESASVAAGADSIATQQTPTPSHDARQSRDSSQVGSTGNDAADHSSPGLDRDSIQIVNLALNLNESRRRNQSGLPLASNGRRPLSTSQPAAGPVETHLQPQISHRGQRDSSYQSYGQLSIDDMGRAAQPGQSPVVDLLPPTVRDDHRAYEFSESTLARAERARRHFELFDQYLRLLPSLPPIRAPAAAGESESPDESTSTRPANRDYNPLQMIRNRRVRYREKCPIDIEAEGWHNIDKVNDWITTIEEKYSNKRLDPTQSIKLPSFQNGQKSTSHHEREDMDTTISPPTSLRRVSRTNSIKAPRPRMMDWRISPEELLADAAWAEDVVNKTKIVDRYDNRLYPDPTELELVGSYSDKLRLSLDVDHTQEDGRSSLRTSLSSSRPAQAHEFKSVGRGRHRSKFHTHSQSARSRSGSSSRKHSRWDRIQLRTGSVSSDSSPERRKSSERKHHIWDHGRRSTELFSEKVHANSSDSRISRAKSPAAVFRAEKNKSQLSDPISVNTKPRRPYRRGSLSSGGSLDDRYNPRMSTEGMDSTAPNSPAHAGYFPSIAVNLSPPSSRSPSPAKKGLRHKIVSRQERSKSKHGERDSREHEDESLDAIALSHHVLTPPSEHAKYDERSSRLEPSPLPDVVCSSYFDDQAGNDGNRSDNPPWGRKGQHLPESKLRGIFKGPGRIAELVGNEVSKVGDLVFKKDQGPDSRKSSSASIVSADSSDSDDDGRKSDKRSGPKGLLRRRNNIGDESGRLVRRDSDRGPPNRSFIGSLPSFTSPLRQDDSNDYGTSPRERPSASRKQDDQDTPRRMGVSRSRTLDFSPTTGSNRSRTKQQHAIKDSSVPFSLTRPPVTGLAQARASPGPMKNRRPGLSSTTRAWSISDRSLHTLNDFGVPGKTEVERTRTLLLSSGIKAREITRRAHSVREPPPHWLQNALGPGASVPRVARIGEFDLAAQNLLRRFEMTQYSFQQSMHHFTTTTASPLRTQLKDLENLVNESLTPRVRATANDAEDLCVQLNTTSTLAVKSLSDALDRGVRKRRRRLRWVRRTGFVVLEWTLVGMLWWVWLIVMAFKLVRGVFRGFISGARWILWL